MPGSLPKISLDKCTPPPRFRRTEGFDITAYWHIVGRCRACFSPVDSIGGKGAFHQNVCLGWLVKKEHKRGGDS